MGYVTLNIEGLSTSYYKNNVWNVVFPCDGEYHRVNFKYRKKNGSASETISLVSKNIRITTEKSVPPKFVQHASFDKVLDLTSEDLHKEGLKFASSPQILKSIMTVENAYFYTAETRNRLNIVIDPRSSKGKYINSEMASVIGGEIELQEDGKVTMEVDGMSEFRLDFEEGDLLHFDNDCCNCTFSDDFQFYQEIFENSRYKDLEFKMLSFPLQPREFFESDTKSTLLSEANLSFLLAGPPPAFCDGSRISETGDL